MTCAADHVVAAQRGSAVLGSLRTQIDRRAEERERRIQQANLGAKVEPRFANEVGQVLELVRADPRRRRR